MPRNSHSHSNRRVPRTIRLDEQFREEISKLLMKGLKASKMSEDHRPSQASGKYTHTS